MSQYEDCRELSIAAWEELPTVAILLSTHNGARYLAQQLDSIISQSYPHWQLAVSDDGSCDGTLDILLEYQKKIGHERLTIKQGPCLGFYANFLSLVADETISANIYAFCDQDDLWHPDKLARGIEWLAGTPYKQPALYCGRTRLVDKSGQHLGKSPLFERPPGFANALVQSLAGGNTMLFNHAARSLLIDAGQLPIISHDWWIYMLVSGAGGQVYYDKTPSIDYRQHGGNLIGANSNLRDRLYRLRRMFAGHFKQWNDINLESLRRCQHLLTEEHRKELLRFSLARQQSLLPRCYGVLSSGVYRQTALGNLGLIVATLLGKI
ncbi:MAG: glycosyltransferase family 2 protein [Pseudomonas sp.]|nr:MAG: glycosyltransferase family 2 protein [Pseudomonas sp.]